MSYSFGGVEAAKSGNYLKPGYYRVRVADATAGEFPQSKIPYVEIVFETKDKTVISEKFALKAKEPNAKFNPLSRLQYLHEAWLGEKADGNFKTPADIAKFFKSALANKSAGVKTLVVGGEINGKITYGRLPFAEFILPSDADVDLGPFAEDSEEWKQFVKKSTRTTEASGKGSGLLNDDDDEDSSFAEEDEDDDNDGDEDPFADDEDTKVAAKKSTKAPAAPAKKAAEKEAPKKGKKKEEESDGFSW